MTDKEAINLLSQMFLVQFTEEEFEALGMAIDALNNKRKTGHWNGHWIDEDGNKVPLNKDGYPLGSCYCDQCHEWLVGSDEYAIKGNFCPNCGADMRKRRET